MVRVALKFSISAISEIHTKYLSKQFTFCFCLEAPDDAKLGVIRLDYDYPPIPGDVDHPDSFSYDVIYHTIPGFTFEMAQSGRYGISSYAIRTRK